MKSLWRFCSKAPSNGCISLLPPGGAKESKMEALAFLSQLSFFELELQQKQASFFCRCFVVFYICYDLMTAKNITS